MGPPLLYAVLASLMAAALFTEGRWYALLALPPIIFGPWGIVASTGILRLSYHGLGTGDIYAVTEAARDRVLSGLSPYGVTYPEGIMPDTPYPYGPLALLDSFPLEFAASVGIAALLVNRPWTLALYAGLPFSVYLVAAGNNDYVATFLLLAGILTLPRWQGGALIGLSVAWKPYTAVFLPALLPFGWAPIIAGSLVAVVGYLPALYWGGFLDSLAMQNAMQGSSPLRYLAVPFGLAAFRYGLWFAVIALGIFALAGGLWSLGYLIPLGVVGGYLAESRWQRHAPDLDVAEVGDGVEGGKHQPIGGRLGDADNDGRALERSVQPHRRPRSVDG